MSVGLQKDKTVNPAFLVESYKFADIAQLWGRERLAHEVVVSRELAKGAIAEGLKIQSANARWVKASETLRGEPYVGLVSAQNEKPALIRATALEHLLAIARGAVDPNPVLLSEEFVSKDDFRKWLVRTGQSLPAFWFDQSERPAAQLGAAPEAAKAARVS